MMLIVKRLDTDIESVSPDLPAWFSAQTENCKRRSPSWRYGRQPRHVSTSDKRPWFLRNVDQRDRNPSAIRLIRSVTSCMTVGTPLTLRSCHTRAVEPLQDGSADFLRTTGVTCGVKAMLASELPPRTPVPQRLNDRVWGCSYANGFRTRTPVGAKCSTFRETTTRS
jgi:hypothetical protein